MRRQPPEDRPFHIGQFPTKEPEECAHRGPILDDTRRDKCPKDPPKERDPTFSCLLAQSPKDHDHRMTPRYSNQPRERVKDRGVGGATRALVPSVNEQRIHVDFEIQWETQKERPSNESREQILDIPNDAVVDLEASCHRRRRHWRFFHSAKRLRGLAYS